MGILWRHKLKSPESKTMLLYLEWLPKTELNPQLSSLVLTFTRQSTFKLRRKNNHFPNLYQSHSKHPGTRIMPQKMNEVSRGYLKMLLEMVVEVSYQVLARREAERKINHLEQEPFPLQCCSSKLWPLLQKDKLSPSFHLHRFFTVSMVERMPSRMF